MGRGHQRGFWEQVDTSGDCWLWQGRVSPDGYGKYRFHGKEFRAHRWAYNDRIGPIPVGAIVMHSCDTPLCVRPTHLRVGTVQDNVDDMRAKGRGSYTGPRTHPPRKVTGATLVTLQRMRRDDHTQTEIANALGLSQSHVSRLLRAQGG